LKIFAFWNIICIIYKEDLPTPIFILPHRRGGENINARRGEIFIGAVLGPFNQISNNYRRFRILNNPLTDESSPMSDGLILRKKEVEKRDTNGYINLGFY
jgi:hypothetical protein